MKESLRTYRWQLVGVAILLTSLYVTVTFLVPQATELYAQYNHIHRQQERIASAVNWKSKLEEYNRQKKQMKAFFSKLMIRLEREEQMSAIVELLYHQAEESGVDIVQIRPGERTVKNTFISIPLQIKAKGGFHTIAGFIDGLEQANYLVKLSGLTIKASNELTNTQLTAMITLQVMVLQNN